MFTLIFVLITAVSAGLIYRGYRKSSRGSTVSGVLILASMAAGILFMNIWADKLWFGSLGYTQRFWVEFFARLASGAVFALLGIILLGLFTLSVKTVDKRIRRGLTGLGGVVGLFTGIGSWQTVLRFLNAEFSGVKDPVLGLDTGFYLFILPFLQIVVQFLFILAIIILLTGIFSLFAQGLRIKNGALHIEERERIGDHSAGFTASSVLFLIMLSIKLLTARYGVLYAAGGVVNGPGWTDDRIRLPFMLIAALLGFLGAIIIGLKPLRKTIGGLFAKKVSLPSFPRVPQVIGIFLSVMAIWAILLGIVPWLTQSLLVAPNEITYEKQYIAHNINFTRKGFKLDGIKEPEIRVDKGFDANTLADSGSIIKNARLWDWRALSSVYEQFQEIRLYYSFGDIDVDRYIIEGNKRAVMISAREMQTDNLPSASQNFVNKRFKYTHGYGVAMNTVNDFTPSGLPNLLIKDIPPKSAYSYLEVTRPEIYYGEQTDSYVIANSSEQEFDYPEGDNNTYVHYAGTGGIEISSFFRKFMFSYLFGGTKLLFSTYPDSTSRIMFYRDIRRRVEHVAPFLEFDRDPYIALIEGRLVWIMDAYTTSTTFPYSEHYWPSGLYPTQAREDMDASNRAVTGVNYIRNSVKAVIDPYNGGVDLYVYDEDDLLIKVWKNIYPDLFKEKSEMPEQIKEHVRYPADFLLTQGEVYAKYHMTDPEVFYNQEDLWVRATEKYYNNIQPVEPYYIMWERPESDVPQFILMLPYTPKDKQVLIGWIAGFSDPDSYGECIAYKFPKEQRILGPQQVETKIDQDSFLSGQLSLWDQRGSNVIRGNVLALPMNGTLLYIEPIYLQSDTAAYPELRMVVLMHGDTLAYAESLDAALEKLLKGVESGEQSPQVSDRGETDTGKNATVKAETLKEAREAFELYLRYTGEGRFDEASRQLSRLQSALEDTSD